MVYGGVPMVGMGKVQHVSDFQMRAYDQLAAGHLQCEN
jgi:hypothetical protein